MLGTIVHNEIHRFYMNTCKKKIMSQWGWGQFHPIQYSECNERTLKMAKMKKILAKPMTGH